MTQLPEEAIEAGARALHAEFSRAYGIRGTIWDDYKLEARATIHAAYPAIEKQVRAEVAAEIRASLPRDLAASTQDLDGWFSDMTGGLNIVVEVDEDMVPVGYGFELEAATGTIDLHLLADIAARIAEGAEE